MTKRLLTEETHHELLVYEGLLALTNIASCVGTATYADELFDMSCG